VKQVSVAIDTKFDPSLGLAPVSYRQTIPITAAGAIGTIQIEPPQTVNMTLHFRKIFVTASDDYFWLQWTILAADGSTLSRGSYLTMGPEPAQSSAVADTKIVFNSAKAAQVQVKITGVLNTTALTPAFQQTFPSSTDQLIFWLNGTAIQVINGQ
jgi:hypothetical protein